MQIYQHFRHQKKVAKVVPAETAETGLQKAEGPKIELQSCTLSEGTTLQFYFGLLKLQKMLLIVSQLFAEISADTLIVISPFYIAQPLR